MSTITCMLWMIEQAAREAEKEGESASEKIAVSALDGTRWRTNPVYLPFRIRAQRYLKVFAPSFFWLFSVYQ